MTTIASPPVWPPEAYIRPVGIATEGERAWTHKAILRPPGQPECRAYVKHFPAESPRALFNEWLGHTLMHALGVPQPSAAMMQAPALALPGAPVAWAFVSCEPVPTFAGTAKQHYNAADPLQNSALAKRIFECHAFPLLVAADQLLNNGDRNLGNLVFTGKHTFVAIDHADILGGGAWRRGDLCFTQRWAVSRLIETWQPREPMPAKLASAILASAQVTCEVFYEKQRSLQSALGYETAADVSAALDAVWWRSLPLAEWFRERLELLA